MKEQKDLILTAYDWLSYHGPKTDQKPADVQYPVWVSLSEDAIMMPDENEVVLELSLDDSLITLINVTKWGMILNYSYIPKGRSGRKGAPGDAGTLWHKRRPGCHDSVLSADPAGSHLKLESAFSTTESFRKIHVIMEQYGRLEKNGLQTSDNNLVFFTGGPGTSCHCKRRGLLFKSSLCTEKIR